MLVQNWMPCLKSSNNTLYWLIIIGISLILFPGQVIGSSVVAQSGLIKTISNNSSSASSPSARSLCDEACAYNIAPVCGSDGKTHDNECWMRKEGCKTGRSIRRLHDGPCRKQVCDDPLCPGYISPVCGNDGRTYDNECFLKAENCRSGVYKVHDGKCGEGINNALPLLTGYGSSNYNNDCPMICPLIYMPMCGSDGRTYASECDFKSQNCHRSSGGPLPYIAYEGACDNNNMDCPRFCPRDYRPVCGSDGITYPNKCNLEKSNCDVLGRRPSVRIIMSYNGPCDRRTWTAGARFPNNDWEDGRNDWNRGKCNERCNYNYNPICGSDRKTYDNECLMRLKSCRSGINVYRMHDGLCRFG